LADAPVHTFTCFFDGSLAQSGCKSPVQMCFLASNPPTDISPSLGAIPGSPLLCRPLSSNYGTPALYQWLDTQARTSCSVLFQFCHRPNLILRRVSYLTIAVGLSLCWCVASEGAALFHSFSIPEAGEVLCCVSRRSASHSSISNVGMPAGVTFPPHLLVPNFRPSLLHTLCPLPQCLVVQR
jgi:hypothetical protein